MTDTRKAVVRDAAVPSCALVPRSGPNVIMASDCAGLNSAAIALELMGLNTEHLFVSEINERTRLVLLHNFRVEHVFHDINVRHDASMAGTQIDLYTAGPPCQPFSTAGLGKGVDDKRGLPFLRVLETIRTLQPRAFIIENVKGLMTARHAELREFALQQLQGLKSKDKSRVYRVRMQLLDTKSIGGLPQSRPRVYIVGWRRQDERTPFQWPREIHRQRS